MTVVHVQNLTVDVLSFLFVFFCIIFGALNLNYALRVYTYTYIEITVRNVSTYPQNRSY